MPQFSKTSLARLASCDDPLQMVANAAIDRIDFTVLCGHRGEREQTDDLGSLTYFARVPKRI